MTAARMAACVAVPYCAIVTSSVIGQRPLWS